MKKSKKNYAIIVLIVILLALAIGYATFTANLTINGTVTGEANWEVIFTDADVNGSGLEDENYGTANISTDGTTLTVDVELDYPGDACPVTATITNNGTIDAKLTNFEFDTSGLSPEVTVDYVDLSSENDVIEAGKSCTYTFVLKWKDNSVANNVLVSGAAGQFTVTFDYGQNDQPRNNVTNAHTHTT